MLLEAFLEDFRAEGLQLDAVVRRLDWDDGIQEAT